jgi:hypothetical protein
MFDMYVYICPLYKYDKWLLHKALQAWWKCQQMKYTKETKWHDFLNPEGGGKVPASD